MRDGRTSSEIAMQCRHQIERDHSTQNARAKISMSPNVHTKFTCSNNLFRGSYFCVLVVGRENCENLDLVKISRYTILHNILALLDSSE